MSAEQAPEFVLDSALLDGWNLIEANAGTGKTYSITGLYLRLLLERDLEPEEILVVTFTRAATSELKTRLLARLREMAAALRGSPTKDLLVATLTGRLRDPVEALRRLERAIRAFDLANVQTLHGFCQQVLNEFSFAVGFDPDVELVEDESAVVDPLIWRQWRRLSGSFSAGFAAYVAARRNIHPAAMGNTIRRLLDKPYAVLKGPENADLQGLQNEFEAARGSLSELWAARETSVRELLSSHRGLNQGRYKPLQIEAQLQAVGALLVDPWRNLKLAGVAARIGREALIQGTRRGFEPPEDPFFDQVDRCLAALEALRAAYQSVARGLPLEVYRGVRESLAEWKRQESVVTYRDLIMDLDAALKGPSGPSIRAAVGRRFRAALVDEFQDTDPIQFDIFRALLEGATVFLVGDPKQSLYGFRGADVFAYLQAREEARRRYRLTRDWRATPALLEALNRLLSARDRPFALPQIQFVASAAAERPVAQLEIDGRTAEPLVAWELPPGSQAAMRAAGAGAVAAEIERLLHPDSGARIVPPNEAPRALRAKEIAVLVRKHDQATEVAGALNRRGIACIQPGVDSVFDTEEAEELERVLHGVCLTELPGRLSGALTTRLLGGGAELAAALVADDDLFETWFERFRAYRQLWEEQGVTALATALIREFDIPARYLPQVDGQRRLTNVLHLIELMERRPGDQMVTPGEQLEWLHRQRQSAEFPGEQALLRLESDDDLVSILTIHKSKGLEFPVVFCPYLWDERRLSGQPGWIEYHRGAAQRLTIDFGSGEFAAATAQHFDEAFAENVRLTYVALTRARSRCYLAWGIGKATGYSTLAYLLGARGESWTQVAGRYKEATRPDCVAESRRRLRQLGVSVAAPPAPPAAAAAAATSRFGRYRTPARVIRPGWSIHSYSSLSGGSRAEPSDYDAEPAHRDSSPTAGAGIHELPPGTRTGLMVHEIFEELEDFAIPGAELVARAGVKLEKFGLSPDFGRLLGEQLHRCLHTPLLQGDGELSLARIAAREARKEMEFHFAVGEARLGTLWQLIRGPHPAPATGTVRGFVRGFIDLIIKFKNRFYIIDYKTNYLGNGLDDYGLDALRNAVLQHHYDLQYHLYTVALHRHLKQRMAGYSYEAHFGGVFYLFVRGMEPHRGPGRGVFHHRPREGVIARLGKLLKA